MTPTEPQITVRLDELPPLAELALQWRELESRAEPSFFLTWSWIGNWLVSLGEHVEKGRLLSALRSDRLVGLAVVFDAPIRRRLLPLGRAAYINETGLAEFDALCIEHNGFLLDTLDASAVQRAMLKRLCEVGSNWREVQVRACDFVMDDALSLPSSGKVYHRGVRNECCQVRLEQVRARSGDFIGLLSAGRRAHVRRCMRAYAAIGPLRLEVASDEPTARSFLERLIVLHDRRWAQRAGFSAFSTPHGRAFHERMLSHALPRGEVQLLRVSAGERELGYLYSFVHAGRVSFYQSGYDYELLESKYSPGLVTLVLAIEHNAQQGLDVFDFLAGDQAYKASLATDRMATISWTVQRHSLLSATERALRWKLRLARRIASGLVSAFTRKSVRVLAAGLSFAALVAGGCYDLELDDGETLRAFSGVTGST